MINPKKAFFLRGMGWLYRRTLRWILPSVRPAIYSGVVSPYDWKWFDNVLPRRFRPSGVEDLDDYESALINGLTSSIHGGDHVVVVGGGVGVTAIIAAKLAGTKGKVTCFEASRKQLPLIKRCIARNGMKDRIELVAAAVSTNAEAYGGVRFALPTITVNELPECDVLEMDCEGAEAEILPDLAFRPRAIAVETHGIFGASTVSIHNELLALQYNVIDLGWAEPRLADICKKNDIRVLLAAR